MTTPVYNYVEPTGVIVPDTSDILTGVQQEYQDVFGADLVVTPDSPQGVLITAEAIARAAVANNNAAVANQINPNLAGGKFQDALLALTGMQRQQQTPTVVTNVTVAGIPGTIIPEGSQAQTGAGDLFATTSDITIPGGGNTLVTFASVAFGPIPCASTELNEIVSDVDGWETVNNNGSGSPASVTTLGSTTQSDQSARALRQNTLAFQAVSLIEAITSALFAIPGVMSVYAQENTSGATTTINGISMVGHSIYVCISGGTDTQVAAALLENKSSGCAWNGSTSVSITEPASGQTYTVKFDRPAQIGILISVNSPNGNSANIIQAILDYQAGLIQSTDQTGSSGSLPGWTVGADASPFELAAAIIAENPGYIISNLQIGLAPSGSLAPTTIAIGVNQQAITQASYITVNT